MKVDILIPVAERGGCENIINMLVPFLQQKRKWDIRVVQIIYEDLSWIAEGISHHPLLQGRKGHTLEEMVHAYASFLVKNGIPDTILATAWPFMCYVGKKASIMAGSSDTIIFSWLHSPIKCYELAGFGSFPHLALAHAHLVISNSIADELKKYLPDSKIFMVSNPVDFNSCQIALPEMPAALKTHKKLYFIGRISQEKRIDLIIRALKGTNGKWMLYIIGDGDRNLKFKLKDLAKKCQTDEYIQWLGWKKSPWKHMSDADALIICSDYEGFPLVAIEALGNGLPVISTPVSGITDVIVPGVNGYLYPNDDWKSLQQILQLMADNRLPDILPDNCKQSVARHDKELALSDFADKIESFVNLPY